MHETYPGNENHDFHNYFDIKSCHSPIPKFEKDVYENNVKKNQTAEP